MLLSEWAIPTQAPASVHDSVASAFDAISESFIEPQGAEAVDHRPPTLLVANEPKDDISAACSEVALAVVLSRALFRFLEELEITGWDAANPSAFPVLELDELRRHAHRRHADDDVETSPVADDCSDFEHGRMRTPTGCTTAPSAA